MDLNKALLTPEGFLVNWQDWNAEIAVKLATTEAINLTDEHWVLLYFMRDYYKQFNYLPNTRIFIKTIAQHLGHEKGNSPYLMQLFPNTPLKLVCKIAGLPKPPTCL
jgi:tRNA 2-thiouridine synthesizing protein E